MGGASRERHTVEICRLYNASGGSQCRYPLCRSLVGRLCRKVERRGARAGRNTGNCHSDVRRVGHVGMWGVVKKQLVSMAVVGRGQRPPYCIQGALGWVTGMRGLGRKLEGPADKVAL